MIEPGISRGEDEQAEITPEQIGYYEANPEGGLPPAWMRIIYDYYEEE